MKTKNRLEVWDESCLDCAVKRGWRISELLAYEGGTPTFECVHRTDLNGKYKVCAGLKKHLTEKEDV